MKPSRKVAPSAWTVAALIVLTGGPAAARPRTRAPEGPALEVLVGPGDTVRTLARRYNVPPAFIRQENHLAGNWIAPGRRIRIPGGQGQEARSAHGRRVHVVEQGETLDSIAREHDVPKSALFELNARLAAEPRSLQPGAEVALPRGSRTPDPRDEMVVPRRLSKRQARWVRRAAALGLGSNRAVARLLAGDFDPRWIFVAGRGNPPRTFQWPVPRGWFVRGYGAGRNGGHLSVDVMAVHGSPVVASDSGVVGYAGNGISGYGNLVVILHPSGWATGYAHNSSMAVVPGQPVNRGDLIARVGQTGNATGPHVHFMWFMNGGDYCDPLSLFRPAVMHRGGRRSSTVAPQAVLRGVIPRGIACRPRPARGGDGDAELANLPGSEPAGSAASSAPAEISPAASEGPALGASEGPSSADPPAAAAPAAVATP